VYFRNLLLCIWPACRFREGDDRDDNNSADWWMLIPSGDRGRDVPVGARVVRYDDDYNGVFTIRDHRVGSKHPCEWERLMQDEKEKPRKYWPGFLVYAISRPDGVDYEEAYIVNLQALRLWHLMGKVDSRVGENVGAAQGLDSYFRVFRVDQWPPGNPVVHKWSDIYGRQVEEAG